MTEYRAPWSKSLVAISVAATLLCLCASYLLSRRVAPWLVWFGPAIIASAAPFMVLGYAVTPEAILVRRPLRTTKLPRAALNSARLEPDAMSRSLRVFGNAGLYSFTGLYRSRNLGMYRAFVTDPGRTVVLRLEGRTVVVSPADPERFVTELGVPAA